MSIASISQNMGDNVVYNLKFKKTNCTPEFLVEFEKRWNYVSYINAGGEKLKITLPLKEKDANKKAVNVLCEVRIISSNNADGYKIILKDKKFLDKLIPIIEYGDTTHYFNKDKKNFSYIYFS